MNEIGNVGRGTSEKKSSLDFKHDKLKFCDYLVEMSRRQVATGRNFED